MKKKHNPLTTLLERDEGESIDFKQELSLNNRGKYELAKDCSGFANSHGGIILVGVSERPRFVVGIGEPLPVETIVQIVGSRTYPPVQVNVASSTLKTGRYLGVITIPQSKFVHYIVEDRAVYVRHGPLTE